MKKVFKSLLKVGTALTLISVVNEKIKRQNDFSLVEGAFADKDLFYESKYGNIRYKIEGKTNTEKPKMLMLHELMVGGSLNEYCSLSKLFSHDYEVYRLDMLGYGHSDKPNISYNSYLYTTLINDFIKDVINDDVFILATGASADFAFSARELNEERIKKLFLINPDGVKNTSFYGGMKSKVAKMFLNLPIIGTFSLNVVSSRPLIKKYLLDNCFYNPVSVTDELVDEFFYNAHYKCEQNRFSLSHLFTNFLKINTKDKILKSEKETTIILGENCRKFESYNVKSKLESNKNNKTIIVPLSRELVTKEKPNEIYNIIIDNI